MYVGGDIVGFADRGLVDVGTSRSAPMEKASLREPVEDGLDRCVRPASLRRKGGPNPVDGELIAARPEHPHDLGLQATAEFL